MVPDRQRGYFLLYLELLHHHFDHLHIDYLSFHVSSNNLTLILKYSLVFYEEYQVWEKIDAEGNTATQPEKQPFVYDDTYRKVS